MVFNPVIIHYLNMKVGCDVTTPAGATILANDIELKTGEKLAANTIKRLVGILPYESLPRITTLNIIGRYIGYKSWDAFMVAVKQGTSIFGDFYPFVEVCRLKPNALISFEWEPDRQITLRHTHICFCEVISVTNSKLKEGDVLELAQLADGFPFFVKNVIRNGECLGSYTAATETGIHDLKVEGR